MANHLLLIFIPQHVMTSITATTLHFLTSPHDPKALDKIPGAEGVMIVVVVSDGVGVAVDRRVAVCDNVAKCTGQDMQGVSGSHTVTRFIAGEGSGAVQQ